MEIPLFVASALLLVFIGMQTWILTEIVALKTKVAVLCATCDACPGKIKAGQLGTLLVLVACITCFSGCKGLKLLSPGQAFATNSATGVITTNEVFTPNKEILNRFEAVKDFNSSVNPTPTAPIINGILGLGAAALGLYARWKTVQSAERLLALKSAVAGVETHNSPDLKRSIEMIATVSGGQTTLAKVVDDLTARMTPAAPKT